ncbi:16S rRNA (guanine(966)-N(2))-methyltransferase RsmD [Terracidiphilus sp.]|jgi:16S rRNA (guanine(966)-N(2))-methyltransferase RsmD|uniref:16S rRNA (guanine(966)-N(2))-methyltransferase RsmD n=1 Tax=Terracidiphilus sp. TaxID=1964191 RepID=UPI003C148F11
MRVIAGQFRSRTLDAPAGLATRPTSDRLRETIFNVLTSRVEAPRIEQARFLDLYSGSGAVGIEALSRAASHVTFVEKARPALTALRANLTRLGITGGFTIHNSAVTAFLRQTESNPAPAAFDIVFLDPPYDLAAEYSTALNLLGNSASSFLAPQALVIAEHRRKDTLADTYGNLTRTRLLQQGDASLSFYSR